MPDSSAMSTVSLNSDRAPAVPMNTPAKVVGMTEATQMNQEKAESLISTGLMSCWMPFLNTFQWMSGARPAISSDSDSEGYEISLESIDVNFNKNYIGGGNQSSVFRGTWHGRSIALKKLNRASDVDIKKLMALDHPNVVQTFGICTKDIYPCIVMEYCEQGGLFDVLRQVKVSKYLFTKFTKEIAEGMHYLHAQKIVHRDLKSPNVLVDKDDNIKICDFGSLYSWEKTHMQSVPMSVCGTSQWMPPEMMKNEPCSEKVDIWSFGVVLWEILTQEVPYKNIAPMAIMYGVGSDKLRLHVPKTAPECAKLLLKSCWAKRPRNRPSFASILNHLANLRVEVSDMSEDAWRMRQEVWRKEISEEHDKLMRHNSNTADYVAQKNEQAEELVQKRMHELRHAQEIRQMYDEKMKRVNKMMKKIFTFLEEIKLREDELLAREALLHEEEQRIYGRASAHAVRDRAASHGPRSVKIQKPMVVRAGPRSTSGNIDGGNDVYSSVPGGHHAVLALPADYEQCDEYAYADEETDDMPSGSSRARDSSSEDEALCYLAAGGRRFPSYNSTPQFHDKAHSSVHMSSCVSEHTSFSRLPATRASVGHQYPHRYLMEQKEYASYRSPKTNRNSVSHLPVSESERNFQEDSTVHSPSVCPCCAYQFKRNSVARISGISADSGVCHLDEHASTLTLDEFGGRLHGHLVEQVASPLYRNSQARWSDGRIHHRRKPRRSTPQSTFTRDSPMRTPSLKREKRLSTASSASAQARISVISNNSTGGYFDPDVPSHEEQCCASAKSGSARRSRNDLRAMSVEEMSESVEMGVDIGEEDVDLIQIQTPAKNASAVQYVSPSASYRGSLAATEASNMMASNNRIEELKSEQLFAAMDSSGSTSAGSPKKRQKGNQ
ncbi:mitogen-activated protein kinase kinase kinase 12 [Aphelenchoides avenae]|nr:mitogen-activated protein kinase kinase kinase 12 [Aphelenchus avenae]